MWQTACLVVNPITVNNFADLFNFTPVGRFSELMMAPAESFQLSLLGPTGVQLLDFCCSSVSELGCDWVLVLFHLSDESWFICSLFWFIDEWRSFARTEQLLCVYEPQQNLGWDCCSVKPPVIYYWPFQGDAYVVVYSNCHYSSAFCLSFAYGSIYLG